jgi:hypothetical protein
MVFPLTFNLSDLDGTNGFVINGIDGYDNSGSVSGAGDINGDGIADLIIGAPGADPNGNDSAGESYVVFGSSAGFSPSLELSNLDGTNGFVINGIDFFDRSGESVSGAGDVNGDGIADLIIGAFGADPNGNLNAGESYVVFGSSAGFSSSLELSTLDGTNGFVINGIDSYDRSGESVSGAGDVNGDGIADLIIGAFVANPNGNIRAGESYVVFGSSAGFSSSLELSTLDGTNGFVINGIDTDDRSGYSVSGAGDINGDGIADLIIGAPNADPNGNFGAGESYVVFGSSAGFSPSLELSNLDGTNGFVINGIDTNDRSGYSVSGAGDINGDGIADLIIGAPNADPNGNFGAGESYVVFGSSAGFSPSLELSNLDGTNGFVINGIGGRSGESVSGAGDINGDGIADLIIGARFADPNGNFGAGESYVVFGSSAGFSPSLELSNLDGTNGFVINGIDFFDYSGESVSGAGDVNGDGIADLIIGAYGANPNGNSYAGESYVVFGNTAPTIDLNTATPGIDFTASFTASPVQITSNLSISDDNSSSLSTATIAITNPLDSAAEILTANTENTSITANYNPNNGTLTLTGRDTIANYKQVLQSITYKNTLSLPATTARIIEFVVDDGQAFSNTSTVATTTLSINANTSIVDGTLGRDTLSGTPINDRIAGSFGADNLTGGGGNNVFVYNSIRDSGDTITDFQVGGDVILLSRSLFQPPSDFNYDIATNGGFLGFRAQGNDTTILIDPDGTAGSALPTPLVQVSGVAVADLASATNFVV